jgi:hypothetical protein
LKVKAAPIFTTSELWRYPEPVRNTHIKIYLPPHQVFTIKTQKFSQTKLAHASKSEYPNEFKRPYIKGLSTNLVAKK